jgi:hypothetical protein
MVLYVTAIVIIVVLIIQQIYLLCNTSDKTTNQANENESYFDSKYDSHNQQMLSAQVRRDQSLRSCIKKHNDVDQTKHNDVDQTKKFNENKKVHWRDENGSADLESVTFIPDRHAVKFESDIRQQDSNKYEDLPIAVNTLNNIELINIKRLTELPEEKLYERAVDVKIPDYELMDYKPRKMFVKR